MNQTTDSTTEYQQFLSRRHGAAWARRTAERNAAFLLPHLRPGMRLLDAGCGPGSITLGLAKCVAPGEVVGIDVSGERIEQARGLAAERGGRGTNVRFEEADVYALPFEDATADAGFDAAFMHAVLQHLADPLAALREVRRVLRPGAVIGISDADHGTGIVWPPSDAIHASFEMAVRLREHDGGTPYAGRMLRALLHDAGFERVTSKAVAGSDGGPAEVNAYMASWQAAYFEEPAVVARLTSLGMATEAELREMAAAWRAWGEGRGRSGSAWGVRLWGGWRRRCWVLDVGSWRLVRENSLVIRILPPLVIAWFDAACGSDDPEEVRSAKTAVARIQDATAPWSARAPMPTPSAEVASAVINGKIYVVGGFTESGQNSDVVEVYDPATDSWSSIEPMPERLDHAMAAAANGKLYVMGGWRVFGEQASDAVHEYDPATESGRRSPRMPFPRAAGGCRERWHEGLRRRRCRAGAGGRARVRSSIGRLAEVAAMAAPREHLAACLWDVSCTRSEGDGPTVEMSPRSRPTIASRTTWLSWKTCRPRAADWRPLRWAQRSMSSEASPSVKGAGHSKNTRLRSA